MLGCGGIISACKCVAIGCCRIDCLSVGYNSLDDYDGAFEGFMDVFKVLID